MDSNAITMEVCDLNECDFLETKFIEYENYEEYVEDFMKDINKEKYKGIFAYFENEGHAGGGHQVESEEQNEQNKV